MRPRDLVLKALNRQEDRPGSQKRYLVYEFQEDPHLDERDRAFIVHLVQGVFIGIGKSLSTEMEN